MENKGQAIIVCALVHRTLDGVPRAFVAKRARTKQFYPNQFELPGGHVEPGEDTVSALKREFREELNARIHVGNPFAAFMTRDVSGKQAIEVVYFATFVDPSAPIVLNREDHSEYRWVSLEEVPPLATVMKPVGDDEFVALRRGLALLAGAPVDFG